MEDENESPKKLDQKLLKKMEEIGRLTIQEKVRIVNLSVPKLWILWCKYEYQREFSFLCNIFLWLAPNLSNHPIKNVHLIQFNWYFPSFSTRVKWT